jgi:hypothetical protein
VIRGRRVGIKFKIGDDLAEEKERAFLLAENIGVLARSSRPLTPGPGLLQYGSAVDERAHVHIPEFPGNEIHQGLQPLAQHLVVIAP